MSSHTWTLFFVMLATGIFGGLVNYFLTSPKKLEWNILTRSLVIGLGAAFLVPVFLNMISSDLLAQSAVDANQLLVFSGFSLIAAISSRAFISTVSQRILKEAESANKQAKELKKKVEMFQSSVEPIIERETEQDVDDNNINDETEIDNIEKIVKTIINDDLKVLKSLGETSYTLRSITGVSKDTKLNKKSVNKSLNILINLGLAVQTMGKKGLRWYITQTGRSVLGASKVD